MKILVIVLTAVALGLCSPRPNKLFHEHLEDFIGTFIAESGIAMEGLLRQYSENREFFLSVSFLRTTNFRDIVYEIESLQEFKAVVDFLERHNIDVQHLLNRVNEMIDTNEKTRKIRHEPGGKDLNAFLREFINLYPREKLAALYKEKKTKDDEFRKAVENLNSSAWNQVYNAFWENETFQKERRVLAENGIDIQLFVQQIKALFGQE